MSSELSAITIRGLAKAYTIRHQRSRADTFVDAIGGWVPWGRKDAARSDERLWALRDVTVDVRKGEVVGVIGPNGAGKSTLLKILSRITEPTEGEARIVGRVGSLLEVGTGFHPELTGRDNIFLNGALIGMRRKEIQRRFDEIVDFAEVERFLDTPVKHYSSGMYVRLAFAVAAHLEPEILLLDEVLAVGDAAFQRKCLGRVGDLAAGGRTILFVSHNLGAVANLCSRSLLLEQGRVVADGPSSSIIQRYLSAVRNSVGEVTWKASSAPGNERVRFQAVRIVSGGVTSGDVDIAREVRVEVDFVNLQPGLELAASIHLLDKVGVVVLASANLPSATTERDEWFGRPFPAGRYRTACTLPANFLNEGMYAISAFVLRDVANIEVEAREALSFTVHESGAMRGEFVGAWQGLVRPRLHWSTTRLDE